MTFTTNSASICHTIGLWEAKGEAWEEDNPAPFSHQHLQSPVLTKGATIRPLVANTPVFHVGSCYPCYPIPALNPPRPTPTPYLYCDPLTTLQGEDK